LFKKETPEKKSPIAIKKRIGKIIEPYNATLARKITNKKAQLIPMKAKRNTMIYLMLIIVIFGG
jgi:hypothetical protein